MKKLNCHSQSVLKLNSYTMILKNVKKKSRFETPHLLLRPPGELQQHRPTPLDDSGLDPSHRAVPLRCIDSIAPRASGPLGAILIVRFKKRKSLVVGNQVCMGLPPIVCNPNIHGQSLGAVHASLCITLAVAASSPPFSVHLTS